jgi:hypothetical protein
MPEYKITTESIWAKHFGDSAAVNLLDKRIEPFFEELNQACLQELAAPQVLSDYRISNLHNLFSWGNFPNLTQLGKYALRTKTIAGDGAPERRAIISAIWEYHKYLISNDLPFTFLCGVCLWLLTSCTPY